ncbi:FAD-dependent oxidoreductase [Nonlabens agnitus]|uniref:Monooxygenase n=1 Tax=Nonlabens agnitus TaxID=870484 RepID=A0A2S9WST6_9FLAO|nr:NAD(P)/FAD-dependent oxidoreductase [Nonlabens agnitus]PRP66554.1 monooxygenase [Nonlabens agnitus]
MFWKVCTDCLGRGKKSQRIRKKAKLQYQKALADFQKSDGEGKAPKKPKGHLKTCTTCNGTGLVQSDQAPIPNQSFPHVAIVGAGIGGVALAVACLHRGIPFTLFERDASFDARSQGYGLTLQQASKAMAGFGIQELQEGVVSTRHVVHHTDGKKIAEWGMRKWMENSDKEAPKKTNIHIARQALRQALIDQINDQATIQWNHQFIDSSMASNKRVQLRFKVNYDILNYEADLVVGADGIRSQVRNQILSNDSTPLRYLDCIVILGICPLSDIENSDHELLDSATVFQTANGHERMYMMPYSRDSIMWQFSFPMSESDAKSLSAQGSKALKLEAIQRTQDWHAPIPQTLRATQEDLVTGYPVYDREVLDEFAFLPVRQAGAKARSLKAFDNTDKSLSQGLGILSRYITLLGDAAHPMSPFKGQGANQALLDALSLARLIYTGCRPPSNWREKGIRTNVLNAFEKEMIERSTVKVKESAAAADFLHSDLVLKEIDAPRGSDIK